MNDKTLEKIVKCGISLIIKDSDILRVNYHHEVNLSDEAIILARKIMQNHPLYNEYKELYHDKVPSIGRISIIIYYYEIAKKAIKQYENKTGKKLKIW